MDEPNLNASLWSTLFGFGELGMIIFMVPGYVLLFSGIGLFAQGWRELYRARQQKRLVTDELYGVVRHPQYLGLFIGLFGEGIVHWPTFSCSPSDEVQSRGQYCLRGLSRQRGPPHTPRTPPGPLQWARFQSQSSRCRLQTRVADHGGVRCEMPDIHAEVSWRRTHVYLRRLCAMPATSGIRFRSVKCIGLHESAHHDAPLGQDMSGCECKRARSVSATARNLKRSAQPSTERSGFMEGLLWLLIWGAFFYFMMRFGCGSHMVHGRGHGGHGAETGGHEGHGGHAGHGGHGRQSYTASGATKDPVCGMEVAPDNGYSRMFEGREYRFCSRKCLDQFDANPAQYAK